MKAFGNRAGEHARPANSSLVRSPRGLEVRLSPTFKRVKAFFKPNETRCQRLKSAAKALDSRLVIARSEFGDIVGPHARKKFHIRAEPLLESRLPELGLHGQRISNHPIDDHRGKLAVVAAVPETDRRPEIRFAETLADFHTRFIPFARLTSSPGKWNGTRADGRC